MNYIKICLSGVLQYFCNTSSTSLKKTYTTAMTPTKASIVGLISSALGYDRDSDDIKTISDRITVKYETIQEPTILNDFQTVRPLKSQQYCMSTEYKKHNSFVSYEGKKKNEAIVKSIQFLQDGEFEVYVGGSDDLLKEIYNALRNPTYALFIGKRSCVPNKPFVTNFELISEGDLENVSNCI